MRHQLYILSLVTLLLLSACKKESPMVVYTTTDGLNWQKDYAQGNFNYALKTTARSTTAAVRHIVISTFDAIQANKTVVDTILQDPVKELELTNLYHTGSYEDTTTVKFTTKAYATDGESSTYTFCLVVLPNEQPISPVDDITMYSALSGRASFFSLATMQPVMSVDQGVLYFRDVAPKDSTDELSKTWTSPNVYFSRSENFDYAKATATSIRNTYNSCTRDQSIQDLKANDVLLFGTATDALGAIKIIYIADEEGRNNDRYIFSMKALPKTQ